jgi:hypothetical protein
LIARLTGLRTRTSGAAFVCLRMLIVKYAYSFNWLSLMASFFLVPCWADLRSTFSASLSDSIFDINAGSVTRRCGMSDSGISLACKVLVRLFLESWV